MDNKKGIYRLNIDFRRMGDLNGIFIADKEHVEVLIKHGIVVYFGEVLGKHSEIFCSLDESDITLVSDNPEAIKIIKELRLENGYNPFDYSALNFTLDGYEDDYFDDMSVSDIVELIINGKSDSDL